MRNIECISLLQILTDSGGNNRERLIVQYCNSNVFISFSRRGILIFATIKHSLVPSVDAVQCAPRHQLGSRTDGGTMIIFSSVVGTQSVRCHHCALLVYINITCPLIGDRSIVSVRGIYRAGPTRDSQCAWKAESQLIFSDTVNSETYLFANVTFCISVRKHGL